MPKKQQRTAKPDDPEQSKRFIDAAREAQAGETEESAKQAFQKVVQAQILRHKNAELTLLGDDLEHLF